MIIENTFYYHGIERWNLGWPTPNYAGAFLATIIAWLWLERPGRWTKVAGLGLETVAYLLLAKTFSRGALVSVGTAALFYAGAVGWERWRAHWRTWVFRGIILASVLGVTQFAGRMRPSVLQNDHAVTHRLELWKSGVEMLAAAPLGGWGAGESGRAYMNWFQDVDAIDPFRTMVNSYLTLGTEDGLSALVLLVALILGLFWIAIRLAREGDPWAAAAGASLMAWCAANFFTTLSGSLKLWLIPAASIALLLGRAFLSANRPPLVAWRRGTVWCLAAASACGIVLYGAGVGFGRRSHLVVTAGHDGCVVALRNRPSPDRERLTVWSDPLVLGPLPGRELRRLVAGGFERFEISLNGSRPIPAEASNSERSRSVMLLGNQTDRLDHGDVAGAVKTLWIIHPTVSPPIHWAGKFERVVLVLPEVDETGLNQNWSKWGRAHAATELISSGCATDIRAAWPAVVIN